MGLEAHTLDADEYRKAVRDIAAEYLVGYFPRAITPTHPSAERVFAGEACLWRWG